MRERFWSGVILRAAVTVGTVLVVGLCTGTVRAATTTNAPTLTPKAMVAALKAIHYPSAHPKKLTCRGLGAAVKGRHTSFRCVATLKKHRKRLFYARAIAKGGWLCAGKDQSRCAMLRQGFFPAAAADNQGWQEIAVLGWLQAHHIDANGAAGLTCTGTKSPMTCTLRKSPSVTVVLSYQKVGTGYVETARRS